MSKISELGPITGANTRTEDLFVIVNLIQGDDGTKNITRKELVQALQYEIFDRITITGGNISGVRIFNSTIEDNVMNRNTFNDGTINDSDINNPTIVGGTAEDIAIANSTIDGSDFSNGTGNNDIFTNSVIDYSEFNNGTGNNNIFTNSQIDDSLYNNVTIEGGTANNLILTNITIDELILEDALISNSQIITTSFSNGSIYDTDISNSTIINTDLDDVDITNSRFSNGQIWDTAISNGDIRDTNLDNVIITNSVFANGSILDTTANNMTITNSDFSDGTGNNNIFTNTTVQGTIQDSVIANSSFTGTMDSVIANNLQITSSTADGLSQSQSTFDSGTISRSTFEDGVIDQSQLVDFDMELHKVWEPNMDENSYFAIKNSKTGQTEQITYKQMFDEISKSSEKGLKVHVASDGNDDYPGTILQPVRTLKRAAEIALEKAGGSYDRNDIDNAVHISVGPGVYWIDEPVALPDDCSMSSTAGQYATLIRKKPGWERTNGILVGSGCYVQGFSYMDFQVDNFDYPEGGFAIAYRPGALLRRSPYLRDSSQLSNFLRADVEPPLSPFNSKGTIADLGQEIFLEAGHSPESLWEVDDEVTFSSGASGFLSWNTDVDSDSRIYVRNLKGSVQPGDYVYSQRGGTGQVSELGIDDFPNRLVGRGGGCILADRRLLDKDSLYTYVLTFGFTPRSQNGVGYVARDGAGINGIGSLSIFVRTAFYALNGGQVTLNNSGTQFGDISMRSKGNTQIVRPYNIDENLLMANSAFADSLEDNIDVIVDDMLGYLTANTTSGGLGYQGYNADKCYRDTGIITDFAGNDIALNTNYWNRLSGITYSAIMSSTVKGEQLTETIGANEHLRDQIGYLFRNSNTEVVERSDRSINEMLNILENGEAAASPIIWQDTGNTAATNARELIQDNKDLLIDNMVEWIDNNPNFFSYDSNTCRRDIQEFILPAVKYDAMLDTNYNAVTAGNAYYFKQSKAVLENQRNETVSAYERLRNETDKAIEGLSSVGATRAYDRFNQIIDIINDSGEKFTPTYVTYNTATGEATFTVADHGLTVGRNITLAKESITFACGPDNIQISHPRETDPAYNAALPILDVTEDTFTVNVGSTAYTGAHTFVKAEREAVSVIGEAITFSDNANIPANNRNARKQLQTNKAFIQNEMMDWADSTFFMYDSAKCQRDTQEYILPAIKRDMITGTNFNAIQSGIAYRQGITSAVPDSQLTETVGGFTHLKQETADLLTDEYAVERSNAAFDAFIGIMQTDGVEYTPTNATYDPATGLSVLTIPGHEFEVGDQIILAEESLTFSCANTANAQIITEISHPRATDPAFESPIQIIEATADTITVYVGDAGGYTGAHTFERAARNAVKSHVSVNETFTPTDATYNPTTGVSVLTIGAHNIQVGERIVLDKESITFECANTVANTTVQISHPRVTDPVFNTLIEVTAVTDDTITIQVGDAGGYTGAHTFVSADANAVKTVKSLRGRFTPTNATYDPLTGLTTITIGLHELVAGDTIQLMEEALTFECGSPAVQISHPRATDPAFETDLTILSVTGTTITVNVGNANGYTGAHTFVSAKPFAVKVTTPYNGKLTPTDASYDPVTGDMTFIVGEHNLEIGRWISIAPGSIEMSCDKDGDTLYISHPRPTDPAYKQPVRITGVTGTTFTVNVGNAGGYTGAHTFLGAAQDCIDTNAIYWTDPAKIEAILTPETAAYNPATGDFVVTITGHGLTTDDHVEFKPNSFTFSCANTTTGETIEISNPRIGEPNYGMPLEITAVTADTFTVNVGTAGGYTGTHTFVRADADAVMKTTATYDGAVARKQLQANKTFIQDAVDSWIRDNYFVYKKELCQRDTGLILDAVARDVLTGSNLNSVFHGMAYRSGNEATDSVIANELTETVGSITWLKDEVIGMMADANAISSANAAFGEIIDIMENGLANTDVRTFGSSYVSDEAFEARAALQANKQFIIDETTAWINKKYPSLNYDSAKCERDTGWFTDAVSWDIQHGSNAATVMNARMYYDSAVSILPEAEREPTAKAFEFMAELAGQILRNEVVNASYAGYDVSTATYNPVTGLSEITIGAHDFEVGDYIRLDEESLTFSCANTASNTVVQISHPRATDPAFGTRLAITAKTDTTITVDVGDAGGYTGAHTFVSAVAGAVKDARTQQNRGAGTTFTPTDVTYNPVTGLSVFTIGDHQFNIGDTIEMDEESITFECANTVANTTVQISHPRSTDPLGGNRPGTITAITDTTITVDVGDAGGYTGAHTFVSANANCLRASESYTPSDATYDPVTGISEITIGTHNYKPGDRISLDEGSITFECANTVANTVVQISHPRSTDPKFNEPITIISVTGTTITVDVGDAGGYTGAHTFVSAADNAVRSAMMQPTYTPSTASYDPVNGTAVITIGTHRLEAGDWIIMDQDSLTFSCANTTTGVITEISHPRVTDPAYNSPVEILETTATTIKVQVGNANGYAAAHTFVSAGTNCIRKASTPAVVKDVQNLYRIVADVVRANDFSALPAVIEPAYNNTVVNYDAARQTDANIIYGSKPKYQTEIIDYIRETYNGLGYNTDLCYRDIGYIVDAISEDLEYGGNAGTINAASYYWDNALNILPLDQRQPTRLAYQQLGEIIEDVITKTTVLPIFGTNFTPVDASYDPETGVFIADIGAHSLQAGDYVWLEEESITFECANTAANTTVQISHPRATDPAFESPIRILDVSANTIIMNVGDANGYDGVHTFVSADANAIKQVTRNFTKQNKAGVAGSATIAAAGKALANVIADLVDDEPLIEGYIGSRDDYYKTPKALPEVTGNPAMSPSRTFARKALQRNKEFIQDEIINFISDEYFVFDSGKCARDTGYILDAVRRDVQTGSDYNSKVIGKSYRAGTIGTNVVVEKQLAETVEAVQYLQRDIESRLTGTALTRASTAFANVIDAMINDYDAATANYNFGTANVGTNSVNARTGLQLNRAFMVAEGIAWIAANHPLLSYDAAKCARDIGYMVDAVSYDIQHDSNVAMRNVASMYFENGLAHLPEDQRTPTADLYVHLAAVAEQIVLKQTVTKSGVYPETQNVSFGPVAGAIAQTVQDLWTIVGDVIRANSFTAAPVVQEAQVGAGAATGYDYEVEAAIIGGRISTLSTAVTDYLKDTYNYLEYDQVKCRRDVGYMVDAISHDVQYGGNSAMWNAAQIYFVNAVNLLPVAQREPTKRAFTRMGDIMWDIIRNETVPMRTGKSWTPTNVAYDPLTGYATITLGSGHGLNDDDHILLAPESLTFECDSPAIQISHPRASDPAAGKPLKVFYATSTTVTVDVGFANGYTGAHTFVSAARNAVTHTLNSVAQDKTTQTARRYIATEAKELAYMVANIADDNNPTNLPAKVEPFMDWIQPELQNAKQTIDLANVSLTESMINYITTEYKGLSYPKQTCRRDVGIIIDALSHDINYATNYATRLNANMYFSYGTSVLPYDQRQQTAEFFARMATVVSSIVQEQYAGQDISGTPATAAEGEYVANLVRIIEEAIRRDSLDAIPEIVEPDTSWVAADLISMGREIDNNLDILADDVTTWINNEFDVLDYDKAKCRRDAVYILDAFSHDLNYGGNMASRWNADFYFWNNIFRIPEDQQLPTAQAYRELGRLASLAVLGKLPGQVVKGDVSSQEKADQAYELGMIFYNAFLNNSPQKLGPIEEPNFDWEDNTIFRFSRDILDNNRTRLQKEVQRFIGSTYKFIDLPKTKRDAANVIRFLANDFRYTNPTNGQQGSDQGIRSVVAALFDINSEHVFPVFNPPLTFNGWQDLRFKGTLQNTTIRDNLTGMKRNDAYIIPSSWAGNRYDGVIHYWNGTAWATAGNNNVDLLESFYLAWIQMRTYITTNLTPDSDHRDMVNGLFNSVLIESVLRPNFLTFGSLVESIAHQFNGASAGVNRNALPLNFRNLGAAISATASVLSEDGGRIRWSGADELNNQYFARGLRINGRTGRIEGRPFTSSVRKLARRASNSRASL